MMIMTSEETYPLYSLKVGEEGYVIRVGNKLDYRHRFGQIRRLHDMGFVPGTKVRVERKIPLGPMVAEVRGSRVALGKGLAELIYVSKMPLEK